MNPWVVIGPGAVVKTEDIAFICEIRTWRAAQTNREFLSYARAHGSLLEDFPRKPRSVIVTKERVYLSGVSSKALQAQIEASGLESPRQGKKGRN